MSHSPQRPIGLIASMSIALAACGSESTPGSGPSSIDAGANTANDTGAAGKDVVGAFIVEMVPAMGTAAAHTAVGGKVYDGPTPSTVAWDLVEASGSCRLTKPRVPFCSPACGSGKLCIADNRCAGYATAQDLGPVQVTGLGAGPITLEAIAATYDLPGGVTLPVPPAPEGADIGFNITQGPFGAFALHSKAVAPLVSSGTVTLEGGRPLALTWAAASQPDLGRIEVKLDISHHGGSKGQIDCNGPDTGALEIASSLVSKLIDLGVAGFPTITLTRVTTGNAAIAPGMVSLRITSPATREVVVKGVQSCDETLPCPAGQTCRQDKTCGT